MLTKTDILVGQLALARGQITLPELLQCIPLVAETKTLSNVLVQRGHLSFMDAQTLNDDISNNEKENIIQELDNGNTLILSALKQTRNTNDFIEYPGDTLIPDEDHDATLKALPHIAMNALPAQKRYECLSLLGKGGMGHVWKALDHTMQREVALKLLAPHFDDNKTLQKQLRLEAQITGLLEHPSIIPIYDIGQFDDRGPYYAMRIVREPTLQSVIDNLREQTTAPSFTQLITVLRTALLALQYAHDHGVIHRDLKPENLLAGSYGEVFIIDWGVAKIDNTLLKHPGIDETSFPLQPGTLVGTPYYMSPEQARGDNHLIDPRSDVYAMGVILYELLTLEHPFKTDNILSLLFQVAETEPTPPSQKTPTRRIPVVLEEICMKAIAKKPEDRFQTAADMAHELELYLDGIKERQRLEQLADGIITEATAHKFQYNKSRAIHAQHLSDLFALQGTIQSYAPIEDKQPLWELEQKCDTLRTDAEKCFSEAALLFGQALSHVPNHPIARKALADLYWERFIEAEIEGNDASATHFEGLVRQYNDGQYNTHLAGLASLTLNISPKVGVHIDIYHYQRHLHKLKPIHIQRCTNIQELTLPHGSYLLTVEAKNFVTLRIPIQLRRLQHLELAVTMYPKTLIPEDMVIISGGDFLSGRIEAATIDKHTKHLDTFAIMRQPVTCQDYLEYLNDRTWHDFDTALQHAPRLQVEQNTKVYFNYAEDGLFSIPTEDAEGDAWHPLWPICLIDFYDVLDYANWLTNKTQINFRLPSMFEWEKAARGVDGRLYPWGNHFDAAFCNVRDSQRGRPMPVPVGSFTHDRSPYGVMDMAGNIAEWTSTPDTEDDTSFILQGSAYALPSFAARLDWTMSAPKNFCYPTYGFRLVFDL